MKAIPADARRDTILTAIERTKARLLRLSANKGQPGVTQAMELEQKVLRHLLMKARLVK